jgi:hypothetical protein
MRLLASLIALAVAGCAEPEPAVLADVPEPVVSAETPADSLALQMVRAAGGDGRAADEQEPNGWPDVPVIGFDFARGGDEGRRLIRRHLWNQRTGEYRVDWTAGDTALVAFFDVDAFDAAKPAGTVYADGEMLPQSEAAPYLQSAYTGYINDTYWWLAPIKLFDPGVTRGLAPERDTDSARVLTLAFDDGTGLTPGDRYWLTADRATGRMLGWQFHLEGAEEPGPYIAWTGTVAVDTPNGPLPVATRREIGGAVRLYTDGFWAPPTVPEAAFTDPAWARAE